MGQQVGITISGLMGRIKGKDEVIGPSSPRKEVVSPMGQHGRNNNQRANGKNLR